MLVVKLQDSAESVQSQRKLRKSEVYSRIANVNKLDQPINLYSRIGLADDLELEKKNQLSKTNYSFEKQPVRVLNFPQTTPSNIVVKSIHTDISLNEQKIPFEINK